MRIDSPICDRSLDDPRLIAVSRRAGDHGGQLWSPRVIAYGCASLVFHDLASELDAGRASGFDEKVHERWHRLFALPVTL